MIASETAIANIEGKKGAGGLEYRGYRIEDLAGAVSYEETAFLLLHGDLPTANSSAILTPGCGVAGDPRAAGAPVRGDSHTHPPDGRAAHVGQRAVHFDPEVNAPPTDHAANVRKAERMIAQMPTAVAYRERIAPARPSPPRQPRPRGQFPLHGQRQNPLLHDARGLRPLDGALHRARAERLDVLGSGHGLDALGHLLGIVAAIGTLKALHGGANEEAWKVLERVGSPPEKADAWIQDALARKERIMGFGHRVYKTGDPRARILKTAPGWPPRSATTDGSGSPSRSSRP